MKGAANNNVRGEKGEVWVAGVPIKCKRGNSVLACMTPILQYHGHKVTYDLLMGISSQAFRLQFNGCPSAQHSFCGFNTARPAAKAFGYKLKTCRLSTPSHHDKSRAIDRKETDRSWGVLKAAIDRGNPGIADWAESNILVGYQTEKGKNSKLLVRIDKNKPYSHAVSDLPWSVTLLEKLDKAPPLRDSIVWSLETAVKHAYAPTLSGENVDEKKVLTYPAGFAAWGTWIKMLTTYDDTSKEPPKDSKTGSLGNACCYFSLIDARRSAAAYLKTVSSDFEKKTATHLLKAAESYENVVKCLNAAKRYVKFPGQYEQPAGWTKAMREKQVKAMKKALAEERKAIGQIESALRVEGIDVAELKQPVRPGRPVVLDKTVKIAAEIGSQTHKQDHQTRSYMVMRAICLRAAGADHADYETLMTVSGWGPSFAYHPQKFHITYFGPFEPKKMDNMIAKLTGMGWQWFPRGKTPEETWQKIKERIDAGKAVEGEHLSDLLFVGYEEADKPDDRKILICGPFEYEKQWWTWKQFNDWWKQFNHHGHLQSVGSKVTKTPVKTVSRQTLQNIVRLATADERANASFAGLNQGTYGLAAIEKYANDVADTDRKPSFFNAAWIGCHGINPQISGRRCTAAYLESIADQFPEASKKQILAAAAEYDQAHEAWREFQSQLGHRTGATDVASLEKLWGQKKRRQAGANAIRKALEHEKKAVTLLKRVCDTQSKAKPTGAKDRKVLDGVPKVEFKRFEFNVFSSCLRACLEFLGEKESYSDICSYAGSAFRTRWHPQRWDLGNIALGYVAPDFLRPIQHAFQAVGYQFEPVFKPGFAKEHGLSGGNDNELFWRQKIIESIKAGRPVIAIGVIGPPEPCIITGFDEGGDVLIGWNLFQDDPKDAVGVKFEPNGYFRKRDWFKNTHGLFLIGEKTKRPALKKRYCDALLNAYVIAKTPMVREHCGNPDAYEAWAKAVTVDNDFTTNDMKDLFEKLLTHYDAMCMVNGRQHAAKFLHKIAKQLPKMRDQLEAAASCYEKENQLLGRMHSCFGGYIPPSDQKKLKKFANAKSRQELAEVIRETGRMDQQAVDHLEKAILAGGMKLPIFESAALPAGKHREQISSPTKDGKKVVLKGLKFQKRHISQLGCIKGCLDFLGKEISWPWLYGGTGYAFLIRIYDNVDLQGVTDWDPQMIYDLASNLGIKVDSFKGRIPPGKRFSDEQEKAWNFVRTRIDKGVPCYGWELKAFYGDYWIINGYDENGYYYDGWATGGPTPWQKLGKLFINNLEVHGVEITEPKSDQDIVREAITNALRFGEGNKKAAAYRDGLAAFEQWAGALEAGNRAKRDHHTYNLETWLECRKMAVDFLKEANRRLPGKCDKDFVDAASHYQVVCECFEQALKLHPQRKKPDWKSVMGKSAKADKAAVLLRKAGDAEKKARNSLKQIAIALGARF